MMQELVILLGSVPVLALLVTLVACALGLRRRAVNLTSPLLLRLVSLASVLAWLFCLLPPPQVVQAAVPAGYSEYYIPGGSDQLWAIFEDLDNVPDLVESQGLHAVIAVTPSTENTTIYYDHWEDGYDFDPGDPTATADEIYVRNQGEVLSFESSNIPIPRGTATYYDGRDRIYVAGGPATVTRASWPESIGTVFALAWEIYPTKPFLTNYTIPVGEDLADPPTSYDDFDRVYVIVQSLNDGTTVQIDDPTTPGIDVDTTLAKGVVTQLSNVNAGTTVSASAPVQVQFIVGQWQDGLASEIRGYSAVPDTLWDTEYYNPVGGAAAGDTDLYLYNPNSAPITINYEDSLGSGSFTILANSTLSYSDGVGRMVPQGSGVYLSSDNVFWGVGSGDAEDFDFDWGYSLVPVYALTEEYFLGWAPGTKDFTANGSPVFVTPVQDDTTVYVDYSPTDGVADAIYDLDRLVSQKLYDGNDNDNTGMHIWATGPIALAWGEDPDTATNLDPYLDLGYTTLPLWAGWMDVVLELEKSVNPTSLPAEGGAVQFTLVVTTGDEWVYNIDISDTLPPGWQYVNGTTTINFSDGTPTNNTDPTGAPGPGLLWALDHDLGPNQSIVLTFTAETIPGEYSAGFHDNKGQTCGTSTPDENDPNAALLCPEDRAVVFIPNLPYLNLVKTSRPEGVVEVGDEITYTICFSNSGLIAATGVVITDLIPANTTYVTGSVTGPAPPIATPPPLPDPAIEYRTDTGDWVSPPEPPTVTGLRWNIGQLVTGTTHCVSFQVQVTTQAQGITNIATIDSNETDPVDDPVYDPFSEGPGPQPEPEPPDEGPPQPAPIPPTPVPPTPTVEVLPVERLPETGGFPGWFTVVLGVLIIIGAASLLNLALLEMGGRRGDGKGA